MANESDNCPFIHNDSQADSDIDGVGDACDDFPNDENYSIDNDSDGLPDDWEINYFSDLDESGNADSDGDGLLNSDEYSVGTNPTVIDTDNDGVNDGLEVQLVTDPLVADGDIDSDGDGIGNADEILCGSNPLLPDSRCSRGLPGIMLLLD